MRYKINDLNIAELVIWKLDRSGRSLSDLLSIVEYLKEQGVHFLSIQDGFDTSTASGKMVFSVIGATAQYVCCVML